MEIIVLGTNCAKCNASFDLIKRIIEENNMDISLKKEEDILEIMKYNVVSLPGIIIDGEVRVRGYVPSEDEMRKLMGL